MTKTQKEVLKAIEQGGVYSASEWAFTKEMGDFTNEKWLRRIDAVIDLAAHQIIIDHDSNTYHSLREVCINCD